MFDYDKWVATAFDFDRAGKRYTKKKGEANFTLDQNSLTEDDPGAEVIVSKDDPETHDLPILITAMLDPNSIAS